MTTELIGTDYPKTGQAFLGIELTFVILGSCYFVIMSLCSLVLRMPPPGYQVRGINIHTVRGAEVVVPSSPVAVEVALPVIVPVSDEKRSEKETVPVPVVVVADQSSYFSMTLKESLLSYQYWMIVG